MLRPVPAATDRNEGGTPRYRPIPARAEDEPERTDDPLREREMRNAGLDGSGHPVEGSGRKGWTSIRGIYPQRILCGNVP